MTLELPPRRLRERNLITPQGPAGVWLEENADRVALHSVSPTQSGTVYWAKCREEGCLGACIIENRCFAHATSSERKAYIEKQQGSGGLVSLRGVVADAGVLGDAFGSITLE